MHTKSAIKLLQNFTPAVAILMQIYFQRKMKKPFKNVQMCKTDLSYPSLKNENSSRWQKFHIETKSQKQKSMVTLNFDDFESNSHIPTASKLKMG